MSKLGKRLIEGLTDFRDRLRDGRGTRGLRQHFYHRCCCGNFMNWAVCPDGTMADCLNCGKRHFFPERKPDAR